jgi:hypothetical protein
VVSANIRRRHLDESQRALIAAKLANMTRGSNQHAPIGATSNAQAAVLLNVGHGTVERAKQVLRECPPDVVQQIERGERTVNSALRDLKQSKQQHIPTPKGLYDVVVIDPPWPMRKAAVRRYRNALARGSI